MAGLCVLEGQRHGKTLVSDSAYSAGRVAAVREGSGGRGSVAGGEQLPAAAQAQRAVRQSGEPRGGGYPTYRRGLQWPSSGYLSIGVHIKHEA